MTLEEYIARLNGLAFWKEFTFAQNRFTPSPGKELELADNLVWLDDYAFVLQLKQRADQTETPELNDLGSGRRSSRQRPGRYAIRCGSLASTSRSG